ncbi:MAG: hypothetical protein ACYDA0_06435 [Candidatus Dormibacteraceae bacterium]
MSDSEQNRKTASPGVRRIDVTLPTGLVHLLGDSGDDFGLLLAEAVRAGLNTLPPEPQGPANDPDPQTRRRQVADALLYYSGRYWLLSLLIPKLTAQVDELRKELEGLESANAE